MTGRGIDEPRSFTGVLVGNDIRLTSPVVGTLRVSGDEMTGEIAGAWPARVAARRQ